MAYMKKQSAEAMGSFWSWVTGQPDPDEAPATPAPTPAVDPNWRPTCTPPQIYVPFYGSCVNPCPSGQAYDPKDGICKSQMSTTTMLAIGVGVVAGYVLLTKKKRR